jgi:hypothetical protein
VCGRTPDHNTNSAVARMSGSRHDSLLEGGGWRLCAVVASSSIPYCFEGLRPANQRADAGDAPLGLLFWLVATAGP